MSKIGIITMYYNSQNCGGNLQAYALERFLNKSGFDAEQIAYDYQKSDTKQNLVQNGIRIKSIRHLIQGIKKRILRKVKGKYYSNIIQIRKENFETFNRKMIKHSPIVYSSSTVLKANKEYDIFITGSDQVWNLNWYDPNFFLSFADSSKVKISYAASVAMKKFTERQCEIVKQHLSDYQAISVREKDTVKMLESVFEGKVEHVLDPTLLLDVNEWDEICADRIVSEEYLFCYYLGENRKERLLAKKFAKEKKLKIVVIPFANGNFVSEDLNFGDVIVKDSSPCAFLSLIKYAKCIFTDSFHAVVFSNIYKKQHFIFNRSAQGEMSSRIESITNLFGVSERFCNSRERENMKYILMQPEIDYSFQNERFENAKRKSISFLMDNLRRK